MSDVSNPALPAVEAAAPTDLEAVANEAMSELPEGDSSVDIDTDSSDGIDAAQEAGDITPKEAQNLKKKLKIKVDGQESEVEIDFNDEEGLKREFQKSRAFDKRLKEFSSYKSQVEQVMQMLQNDPEALLEKMGYDVDAMSEKRLSRKIEELQKSPEQLVKEKMEKELETLRKEKKEAEEQKTKAELERMKNEAAMQIENDIADALSATKSVLPKGNPIVLQRIAQTLLFAMKNGYPQATVKDVIPVVEKQWKEEMNQFFGQVPDEVIETLVGKQNLERQRKNRIAPKKPGATQTAKQVAKDTGNKGKVEQEKAAQPKKFNKVFDWRS